MASTQSRGGLSKDANTETQWRQVTRGVSFRLDKPRGNLTSSNTAELLAPRSLQARWHALAKRGTQSIPFSMASPDIHDHVSAVAGRSRRPFSMAVWGYHSSSRSLSLMLLPNAKTLCPYSLYVMCSLWLLPARHAGTSRQFLLSTRLKELSRMTVFVSLPYRLPGLLPSTAHPAGLGIPCSLLWGRLRMSGLHTSLFISRVTNPSICSR